MNVDGFLSELRSDPAYRNQIVHIQRVPSRPPIYADEPDWSTALDEAVKRLNLGRLYCHQGDALRLSRQGADILVATGTASGKTFCYTLPLIEVLSADPKAKALMLYPTKALSQDQFGSLARLLDAAGLSDRMAGVFDGDTSSALRRKLRDHGSVILSNPDMLHASLMPQHARWADYLANLKLIVLDELHVYNGIFGANVALLMRRLLRLCKHYGACPQLIASSATIANPEELAGILTGRHFHILDSDGSPRGEKTYVFWNPPRIRATDWRSRRSANVEAHELMAKLISQGIPTIAFSKAKMTAEMIYRYVNEALQHTAPGMAAKVTPYRGGYLPEERREIERQLFSGECIGVSTTRALELGIDVGGLTAGILVGYPGTRASFFQQSGRVGRREDGSVVFLIGLDTSVNQYIMSEPGYVFDKSVERAVVEPYHPFVVAGHIRCAAHEMPIAESEASLFGPYAEMVLRVLSENMKLKKIGDRWYHSSAEVPNHEVPLRNYADENVVVEDMGTGAILGQVNKFDAQPILHPGAVYMHLGETYCVDQLDMDRNIARVKREDVDYYTQPLGGTDIHHIDRRLSEKPLGAGQAYWGEVTAYFNTGGFEKIHFYSLDAISSHEVDLPTLVLETTAFWIVPPETLMEDVRQAGLDAFSGLRGIGYGTRMLLPLFMTCDTLSFSHTVGSVNSPWSAIFVYERYPLGLGFTEKAYGILDQILPQVLENIRRCPCDAGCPCCVGKPLRQYTTWSVERGEGSIPSKAAARMILEGMLTSEVDVTDTRVASADEALPRDVVRLEQSLRRRLERMREPEVFHPIAPEPEIRTGFPDIENGKALDIPDVARRAERRRSFDRDLHKRIAKRIRAEKPAPKETAESPRSGVRKRRGVVRPTDFPGRPVETPALSVDSPRQTVPGEGEERLHGKEMVAAGDALASRAVKKRRSQRKKKGDPA